MSVVFHGDKRMRRKPLRGGGSKQITEHNRREQVQI
jgi:hypothetical protein